MEYPVALQQRVEGKLLLGAAFSMSADERQVPRDAAAEQPTYLVHMAAQVGPELRQDIRIAGFDVGGRGIEYGLVEPRGDRLGARAEAALRPRVPLQPLAQPRQGIAQRRIVATVSSLLCNLHNYLGQIRRN